jgi:ribosome biogenesis GTPase
LKHRISNKLSAKLAHFAPDQLEQLVARAKAMQRRAKTSDDPLDTWIGRVLRKDERTLARSDKRLNGLIVSVTSTSAMAETTEGTKRVHRLGQMVVVGDYVTLALTDEGEAAVIEVALRRTKLSRPDVDVAEREQVIVANVDIVVIVVSVVTPPLHPRLIDRYLVASQQGGAQAAIFVNKLDLLEDQSELEVLDPYRKLGIPVIQGSAMTHAGGDELRTTLSGKTCAFVGHSGVGKSSIVNYLKPDAALEVGSISEGYGRGTHTTTASSRHRLSDGTVLIDTPGIRSFGLRELQDSQIASYFPEFEGFQCRFRDCSHTHEPGCEVQAAVRSGTLDEARYAAYCRLKAELM